MLISTHCNKSVSTLTNRLDVCAVAFAVQVKCKHCWPPGTLFLGRERHDVTRLQLATSELAEVVKRRAQGLGVFGTYFVEQKNDFQ